jgi:hypothetical protein
MRRARKSMAGILKKMGKKRYRAKWVRITGNTF